MAVTYICINLIAVGIVSSSCIKGTQSVTYMSKMHKDESCDDPVK